MFLSPFSFFFFLNVFFSFFFLIFFIATLFISLFFWLCWVFGSCEGFLQLRQVGATLHRGARAFHYRGPYCRRAQAPDAQAQQLWLTGPAAPRHVGSSQTRAQTRVPCTSRQTLNHCATREAHHFLKCFFFFEIGSIFFYLFIFNFIYLFYLWLCWVSASAPGLSPVVASGGHSSLRCAGLSPSRPLLLQSTGSRCAGSAIVAHGPSCSAACGILPDQGLNPCPLHWQADPQPLRHQGNPLECFGFVFVGLFLLLCFPPREVPLAFVINMVWWC